MTDFTRRNFLKVLGIAGAAGAGVVAAGCGGGGSADTGAAADAAEPAAEPTPADDTFTCMDTSGLSETDATMRETLQYTDVSPEADKNCANCSLYVVPEPDAGCGTCLTVKGPIHPEGYCTIWAAMAAS